MEYASMQSGLVRLDQRLDEVHACLQRTQSDLRTVLQHGAELNGENIYTEVDLEIANIRIQDLVQCNERLASENTALVVATATSPDRLAELESRAQAQAAEHSRLLRSRTNISRTLRLVVAEMDDALAQVSTLEFELKKGEYDHRFEVNQLKRRLRERNAIIEGMKAQIEEFEWVMQEMKDENCDLKRALSRERKRRERERRSKKVKSRQEESRSIWRSFWT